MKSIDKHELVSSLKRLALELGKTPTLKEFEASGISKRQIQKHKFSELCKLAGLEANKYSAVTDPIDVVIRPPKIFYFDIECTGMIIESYGLYNQNHNHKDIIEDWSLLSFAGMYEGEEKIHYLDNRDSADYRDDRKIVEALHSLLRDADWVVGHNSDKFDIKKFNTKAEKYNLEAIPEFTQHDTIKMLKKKFALPSYSLDYAARYFDLENKKSSHGKFPGKSLFDECKAGNLEAWKECEAYNKQDVLVTRELFLRIAKHFPNLDLSTFYQKQTCSCGNTLFYKNGLRYRRSGVFQIWRCSKCSKCFLSKENLIDKDLRKSFYK